MTNHVEISNRLANQDLVLITWTNEWNGEDETKCKEIGNKLFFEYSSGESTFVKMPVESTEAIEKFLKDMETLGIKVIRWKVTPTIE